MHGEMVCHHHRYCWLSEVWMDFYWWWCCCRCRSFLMCSCISRFSLICRRISNLVAVFDVVVVVLTCHSTKETQKTHKMTITKMTEIFSRMRVCVCVRAPIVLFSRSSLLTYQNFKYAMIRLRRISFLFYSFRSIHPSIFFFCSLSLLVHTSNSTIAKIES